MIVRNNPCPGCKNRRHPHDKGRAADGRRAYRCRICGAQWTCGNQGRRRRYNVQRSWFAGYQFKDTGAAKGEDRMTHQGVRELNEMYARMARDYERRTGFKF